MSFELDKFNIGGKEIDVVDNTAREMIQGLQPKTDNSLTTTSKTVVGGINELNTDFSGKQDKTDSSLTTTDKNVVGAINELNSDLTWKTLTHSAVSVTSLTDSAYIIAVDNSDEIKNAKEVVITLQSNQRVEQLRLTRPSSGQSVRVASTFVMGTNFLCVLASLNPPLGRIGIGCSANTYGFASVPITIPANSIMYK